MRAAIVVLAACAALAAATPIEEGSSATLVTAEKVEMIKDSMTKGFFEDLSQISQNIIAHAHKLAEQIISSVDEAAKKALESLHRDQPSTILVSSMTPAVAVPPIVPTTAPVEAMMHVNEPIAVDAFKRMDQNDKV